MAQKPSQFLLTRYGTGALVPTSRQKHKKTYKTGAKRQTCVSPSASTPAVPRSAAKYRPPEKRLLNTHKVCKLGSKTHPPTKRPLVNTKTKSLSTVLLLSTLMGCSVTSLQCGTDGDSSFVNLNTTPQVLSQNAREMSNLCAFVYDEKE